MGRADRAPPRGNGEGLGSPDGEPSPSACGKATQRVTELTLVPVAPVAPATPVVPPAPPAPPAPPL